MSCASIISSPTAVRSGVAAAEAGALAMTDVSDGLLADLRHIARASGVVIDVRADALQSDIDVVAAAAQACGADPRAFVLCGGEDHALVACFDGAVPEGWRVIGHVGEGTPAVPSWTDVRGLVPPAGNHSTRLSSVTARPLTELIEDGWAHALEPCQRECRRDG